MVHTKKSAGLWKTVVWGCIILALVFGFSLSGCKESSDEEESYDQVPSELRGTWVDSSNSSKYYTFYTDSYFVRTTSSASMTAEKLKISAATNTHSDTKSSYPNGFSISGTVTASTYTDPPVNTRWSLNPCYLNSDKTQFIIYSNSGSYTTYVKQR